MSPSAGTASPAELQLISTAQIFHFGGCDLSPCGSVQQESKPGSSQASISVFVLLPINSPDHHPLIAMIAENFLVES